MARLLALTTIGFIVTVAAPGFAVPPERACHPDAPSVASAKQKSAEYPKIAAERLIKSAEQFDVVVTRTFDAPVAKVWKAWSEPEYVMRWWGPNGFTSPLARIDFREGGIALVCMRAPKEFGGQDLYNTWSYRKIVPHQLIEFILNFADKDGGRIDPASLGLPPGVPQSVRHVITFKPVAANKTEMTVTEYGYTSSQAHDLSQKGLEECLDKMAGIF